MIAYAAVRNFCAAAVRPLWLDEISTLIIVHQHRVSVMWDALKHGADGLPLPYYLLQWPVAGALGEVSFRVLSILGFSITVACLFLLIRKRNSSTTALLCAAIPLVTTLYDTYAVETRPYTLVIASLSFALICYQRAPEIRWMMLMGLSLAFAQSLHYYAVLGFMPFVLAEATQTLKIGRVLGFPLALGYTLQRTGRRTAALLAGVALCLVVVFVRQESRFWSSYTGRFVSPAASVEKFVGSTGYENLPVVVSPASDFLQLAHYASPGWRTRFVAIVDAEKAVAYSGTDSIDKQLDIMRHYAPLQIYDFGPFAADHPVFLLYSAGTIWDWWPRRLAEDGYTLRVLAVKDVYRRVFLVSRNKIPE